MKSLIFILRTLLYGWLAAIPKLLTVLGLYLRQRPRPKPNCLPLPRPEYIRPDPLIYDQYYLMGLGLAVTWDNPDIQLFAGDGTAVSSSHLDPATAYTVQARIWNSSSEAPAVGMRVHFSYLEFGIGTVSHPIGSTTASVGVKGSASCPVLVSFPWITPDKPGHYCLQVRLDPLDDSNPNNNLGQENTDVGESKSPATFTFALRNGTRTRRTYHLEADTYTPGMPEPCAGSAPAQRLTRHRRGAWPLPSGWIVGLSPQSLELEPDEQITVTASITPPAAFSGDQVVNVNAFDDGGKLAGGVTLKVERP